METELDKYFREQREQEDTRDGIILAGMCFVIVILVLIAAAYGLSWIAVEYQDIIRLKANGNI